MSRIISYKGTLDIGLEDRIRLKTIKGKVGYKIIKFQILPSTPGAAEFELVGKITKVKDPNIGPTVKFTDSDLLAVAYYQDGSSISNNASVDIIFDNEIVNQDITVQHEDLSTGEACNFYLELELINLSDVEAEITTIKDLRNSTIVTS